MGVIGGVLSQLHDKFWHPVAFFSKTMDQAQQHYEIHDRELLAIIHALKEWRPELEGLRNTDEFDILSDHEPLKYFQTKRTLNARQIRWMQLLAGYRFLIKYRPGKDKVLADVLSRKDLMTAREPEQHVLLPPSLFETQTSSTEPQTRLPDESRQLPDALSVSTLTGEVVERARQVNRTNESLQKYRDQVKRLEQWTIEDGLLLG